MTLVTRVNGSRRDPYPPTTVSLLTKPRSDFKSASTTRIGHLNLTNSEKERGQASESGRGSARGPGRKRGGRGESIEGAAEDADRPQHRCRGIGEGAGRRRRGVLNRRF